MEDAARLKQAPPDLVIRDAEERDLPAIFEIYNEQVLHGTATFDTEPRTLPRDRGWLLERDRVRHPVIVAERGGRVVGWASLSLWSTKCAYARAVEESVYVHKDGRGLGVGTALLRAIIEKGRAGGVQVLLARITTENPRSVELHERLGFQRVGTQRRVGEKFGRILDVVMLDLHLDGYRHD